MKLKATDLQVGKHYLSPSGKRCVLLPQHPNHLAPEFHFAYLTQAGTPSTKEMFRLKWTAEKAIGAMKELW